MQGVISGANVDAILPPLRQGRRMHYAIDRKLYLGAFHLHWFHSLKPVTIMIAMCLLIGALLVYWDNRYGLALLFGGLIGAPLGLAASYGYGRYAFMKTFTENKELAGGIDVHIRDGELFLATAQSQALIPREHIHKIVYSADIVLLYRTRALFNIFPRQVVKDTPGFEEYVRRKV